MCHYTEGSRTLNITETFKDRGLKTQTFLFILTLNLLDKFCYFMTMFQIPCQSYANLINFLFLFFCFTSTSKESDLKWHRLVLTLVTNVFIDNSFAWKAPAPSCEFPLFSVNGFTPLTSLVAAQTNIFFFNLLQFFKNSSLLKLEHRQRTALYTAVSSYRTFRSDALAVFNGLFL